MKSKFHFIVIASMMLTFCSVQETKETKNISVCCCLTKNNDELIYYIKNDSENNLFILGLSSETLPEVFIKKSYDSIWENYTLPFYNDLRVLKDTSELFNPTKDEEFEYKPDKTKPETNDFFRSVIRKIKVSRLSLKSDLLLEFDLLMCCSIFLKPGEFYSDTIPLSTYKRKYPEYDLKFVFTYPSSFLYQSEKSYLNYYVEDFLDDSLGISLPEKLDGHKIVYDGTLNYEFVIKADSLKKQIRF